MLAPDILSLVEPLDEHNRRLLEQVHPERWQNPRPAARYDLVVVGAGTAGLVSAAGAAGLGARVALVERHLMGGDCLNTGCVPSKALIAASRVWHSARNGEALGAPPTIGTGDFTTVMERMRRLRAEIAVNDGAPRFKALGIDVFFGHARFVAGNALEVDGARLAFKRAVLATGARAATPPIPGLAEVGFLTHETVFSLTTLPRRLAVIGAGAIGCELAQAFGRFGSQVTVFDVLPRVLPREDDDAAALVAEVLARESVRLELGVTLDEVLAKGTHKMVRFSRAGVAPAPIAVDEVLVAAGRAPNVAGLGLEAAGIEHGPRGVKVDERLRTTNPRVFACGDVASPVQFTHAADAQARMVLRNALFFGRGKLSSLLIPSCTFTSPEVAHVGLLPAAAAAQGLKIQTVRVELADLDRARLDGKTDGFLKLHVKAGSDELVGATLVAARAGDLIGELCLAMRAGVGLKTIADTVHPYPTQCEVVKRAADAWNRTRLTPRAKSAFRLRFRMLR
ncbi:MAG TPA: mercuric reductase [Thermoanaerobaculia bacterium]|jgi:pyruvate/2-oxoglutarate dehydrogenase complex dihydrolipoamide dehydrogenase (E3) component|nr:mercuric reductase [Thermoanaerobaculia bacterium]